MKTALPCGRIAAILLVVGVLALPVEGFGDLYVEFLVDMSGSMWSPVNGKPKIVLVSETIKEILKGLSLDIAVGLRVYPPLPGDPRTPDPGLWVPMEKGTRGRIFEQLPLLNPQGKAPLVEHVRKALEDFPEGGDTKLLLLFCDGADSEGTPFCEQHLFSQIPEGLRIHIFSIGIKDSKEQEELNCLGRQLSGSSAHLSTGDNLASTVLPLCLTAYREEAERQIHVLEEQRKHEELLSKTRLKVEFQNSLDPFFADSVEVVRFLLDAEEIPLPSSPRLLEGGTVLLIDKGVEKGEHLIALQYRMWRGNRTVLSIESTLKVQVEEGKTSLVRSYPRGALYHWDCHYKVGSPY